MEYENTLDEIEGDLARKDFWDLCNKIRLDIDDQTKHGLIPQSILGHANEGHGFFRGHEIENPTMQGIISAIGMDPYLIRHQRQIMVDDFLDCVNRLMDGETKYLTNKKGKPLFGVNFLNNYRIDLNKETFMGGVLVGRMDSIEWRIKTVEHYKTNFKGQKLEIGGGKEYPINLERLNEMGLTLEDLAKEEHEETAIKYYKDKKLIAKERRANKNIETAYVRHKRGKGICDDAALISVGHKYGRSAMLLGFCIDAVDTYSKFIEDVRIGGMDEFIGEHIAKTWKKRYNEEIVTPEQCMEIIYLGAKNNFPKIPISSSHRRFIEYENRASNPTFVNHINFVNGNEIKNFKMGFERMSSRKFYSRMKERLKSA